MSPRYLATGDLHIGAGRNLYSERLAEQQQVWQRIIDLAAERECDAILFAGDAFHRNHPDDDERQAFTVPLLTSLVPVFAINGNSHDWRGHGRPMAVETAGLGELIKHVSTTPETIPLPGGVTLSTLPWTPVARLVADAGGGDRDDINAYAAELLVEAARGLRAQVDGPAVLLAHWSVSGSVTPSGLAVDPHVFREPVLSLVDLAGVGFDAICLGHIHTPGPFAGLLQPPIWYVGSPLPLDFSEGGVEHGCWLLELDDDLGAHIEFLPIESRRFLTLDLEHVETTSVEGAVVRVKDTIAAGAADVVAVRRNLLERGAVHASIALDIERPARPSRGVPVGDDLAPAEALGMWLAEAGVNGADGARLVERGRGYLDGVA